MIDLYDFFKHGIINGLTLNMKLSDFNKIIPKKSIIKKIIRDSANGIVYCYALYSDDFEYTLRDGKLTRIELRLGYSDEPFYVKDKKNEITMTTSIENLIEIFDAQNIKWEVDQKNCFNQQVAFETEGGITISFSLDDKQLNRIIKDYPPFG